MRILTALCLIGSCLCVSASHAEEAAGDWGGVLAGTLRIVVHIKKVGAHGYSGILVSLDQGDSKIPLDMVTASGDHLAFSAASIMGSYKGHWDSTKRGWVGTWSQTQSLPLELKRLDEAGIRALRSKRPQEDAIAKASKVFRSREVTFDSAHGSVRIAGTLSFPEGKGPFPALVQISGSGPNTRDEEVASHKIFYVLADYLNRRGLAVLRYDKRGVGASKGTYAGATTEDFEEDAQAAVEFLKSDREIDPKNIGLLGHSEGGLIAPAVAVRDPSVSFVVLLSAPGIRGDKLITEQIALITAAEGMPPAQVAREKEFFGKLYAAIVGASTRGEAEKIARTMEAQGKEEKIPGTEDPDAAVKAITDPWFLYFLKYDPAPMLRLVKVPVLALAGSLDLQVPPDTNLPAIREALKGNSGATVRELDGMNHLLQKAQTGSPIEYGRIEETVDPEVLGIIGDWILPHCHK